MKCGISIEIIVSNTKGYKFFAKKGAKDMDEKYNCDCAICRNYKEFEMPSDIMEAARNGKLVLFCGAGISTENKIVLPESFYTTIQNELGISDGKLSFSETMQRYCDLPNGRRNLIKKIHERFQYIHSFPELEWYATMFHRELSELYFIKTIITTNWDTYFEEYCAAIPITIPEDFVYWDGNERCVLKIHGSISNLGTIIATKRDYEKCKENLEKGIIGATLKTILANNTVVFVGFSFGDEDFTSILNYLQSEMKDYLPHIYIVTLDSELHNKLDYINSTCIVTDGTFFLHNLKNRMIEEKRIVNCGILPVIEIQKALIGDVHSKLSKKDLRVYPEIIYCLAYQDGICHALDRFIQLYATGSYNIPGMLEHSMRYYDNLMGEKLKCGNYWDAAYYEGYENGLMYISMCGEENPIANEIPIYYLPNVRKELRSYDIFEEELSRVSKYNGKYHKYAIKVLKDLGNTQEIVVHHPPY